MKNIVLSMILVLLFSSIVSAEITGALNPESITGHQSPGTTNTYTLCYSIDITGEGSGKADVLFLTDTTGSMVGYIGGIKTAFGGILSAIASSLPSLDIEYAIADYRNFTDGGNYTAYGVNLRQAFTGNTTLAQNAINSLSASGGADGPESQLRAMVSIANNWLTSSGDLGFSGRADAQKIIIWAGDAPGHVTGDETCASGSPPAGYYPSLGLTIAALNAQGILVFGLNTNNVSSGINWPYPSSIWGSCSSEPVQQQQDTITSATGGLSFYNVGSGGPSIEDAIVISIVGGVEILSNITLSLSGDDGDFTVFPWTQTIIGTWTADDSPVTGCFTFNATAPGFEGTANFDMVLLGNGAELDRSSVNLDTMVNKPPDCDGAYASPNCLWPPNHKFVKVNILGVTDPDGDPVTITITSITSDEPTASDEGSGGKEHAPDATGIGKSTAQVRAERSGNGNGRVYEIKFIATDDKGAISEGSVLINVPHDQKGGDCTCIDDGQNYDATDIN